jgi:hypothetical protein
MIKSTDHVAKVLLTNEQLLVKDERVRHKVELKAQDITKSIYSEKVIDSVAKEFCRFFSNLEIRKIITPIIEKKENLSNEETIKVYLDERLGDMFYTFKDTLQVIRKKDDEANETISRIITELLHPLNLDIDENKESMLVSKINKYLKYDNLYIENTENGYRVFSESQFEKLQTEEKKFKDLEKKHKISDDGKIKQKKDLVKKLRDIHQAYIDIVEIFCRDPKKPTKELNDAYSFLSTKIQKIIDELDLHYYEIFLYKPFATDLYAAEIEWNGNGVTSNLSFGHVLSWDAVRPSLYGAHSNIIQISNISEESSQMTGDEKKLEAINNLISQKRIQEKPIEKNSVKKLEVLLKHEQDRQNSFYITKKGDDFFYKGLCLSLSKKSEYYRVFCVLYSKLPEGGEITYEDFVKEIRSFITKTKNYGIEEVKKFIQDNLTGRKNGFLKYARIPKTEDNGNPLIKVSRGLGVIFNNKMG